MFEISQYICCNVPGMVFKNTLICGWYQYIHIYEKYLDYTKPPRFELYRNHQRNGLTLQIHRNNTYWISAMRYHLLHGDEFYISLNVVEYTSWLHNRKLFKFRMERYEHSAARSLHIGKFSIDGTGVEYAMNIPLLGQETQSLISTDSILPRIRYMHFESIKNFGPNLKYIPGYHIFERQKSGKEYRFTYGYISQIGDYTDNKLTNMYYSSHNGTLIRAASDELKYFKKIHQCTKFTAADITR